MHKNTLLSVFFLACFLVSNASQANLILADYDSNLTLNPFFFEGGGNTIAHTITVGPAPSSGNSLNFNVVDNGGFNGFGDLFEPSPMDWSSFTGLSFSLFGNNTGNAFQFELFDNRSDPLTDTSERFDVVLLDDFSGWRTIEVAFIDFSRATDFQPTGAPDDGLTLSQVWGWALVTDRLNGSYYFDNLTLVKPVPEPASLLLLLAAILLLGRQRSISR